jgi:O-acetyl-ADP-ribose deacetylase (regulator of RNase III)
VDGRLFVERGEGSILDADVDALVNPVNCAGVMGKGLALAFKKRFPEVFREYRRACDAGELALGRVHIVELPPGSGRPTHVVHFPTKQHWRDRSALDDIATGLDSLVAAVRERAIRSIAIPALGCGLGGLEWTAVKPLVVSAFAPVGADVRVVLFEPT